MASCKFNTVPNVDLSSWFRSCGHSVEKRFTHCTDSAVRAHFINKPQAICSYIFTVALMVKTGHFTKHNIVFGENPSCLVVLLSGN